MARIQEPTAHRRPHRTGSRTHRPVKLVGLPTAILTKPTPETPQQTNQRTTAGAQARLARAMKANRYLHFTR